MSGTGSEADPAAGTGDAPAPAAEAGEWELADRTFAHLPVHAALLHSGKVLAFGGSGNDETSLRSPHPAELFDPRSGTVETVEGPLAGDVFCAGHSFLPDGRLLVAGGTYRYDGDTNLVGLLNFPPFSGLDHAYLFEPEAERWTRTHDPHRGRWYPTLLTLGDGSVLSAAGLTKHPPWVVLRAIERYDPAGGWTIERGIGRWLPLYPRLHLLPDGTVFYAGSYNTHYTFPFSLGSFPTSILDPGTREWTDLGLPNEEEREEGASVLLPLRPDDDYRPRVLLAGGGTPTGTEATADAEVIDLGAADPRWHAVDSMAHARYYTYPVLLPDGTVFVMGGRSGAKGHADGHYDDYDPAVGEVPPTPNAVREAERFDPATETWTTLAPMAVDRLYHSNALLLPDGRVATMGSNPKRRVDERRIELYRPPYLFAGDRPSIDGAPERVGYGEGLEVGTPDAADVDELALIRQSATTHCVNTDQRYVELPIEGRDDGAVRTTVPGNRSLLPPGYYLLFVLRDGVPSEAPFVRIG